MESPVIYFARVRYSAVVEYLEATEGALVTKRIESRTACGLSSTATVGTDGASAPPVSTGFVSAVVFNVLQAAHLHRIPCSIQAPLKEGFARHRGSASNGKK